jgi:hypothetical protein
MTAMNSIKKMVLLPWDKYTSLNQQQVSTESAKYPPQSDDQEINIANSSHGVEHAKSQDKVQIGKGIQEDKPEADKLDISLIPSTIPLHFKNKAATLLTH